jgi:signal peptidase
MIERIYRGIPNKAPLDTAGRQGRGQRGGDRMGVWEWLWVALVAWVGIIFFLINIRWPSLYAGGLNIYVAQPLTWTSLALLGYLGWRYGIRERPKCSGSLATMSILAGLFQVAVFALAGLSSGFGHSPYSHQGLALLGNMLYLASMLVGVELARAYLVAAFGSGSPALGIVTPTLLFTCLSVPLGKYATVVDTPSMLKFHGATFLPAFSSNLLASYLAFLGGPLASIGYRAVLEAFEWYSPILPRLDWTLIAFLGTMAPAAGMLALRGLAVTEASETDRRPGGNQSSTAWVVTAASLVGLLWFNAGMFGVRPTLVSGMSMRPTMVTGDICITRDIAPEEVQVGDIIRFRGGGAYVLHRVQEIHNDGSELMFTTRGDANNTDDPSVSASAIEGKVILILPKVGWLAVPVHKVMEWFG